VQHNLLPRVAVRIAAIIFWLFLVWAVIFLPTMIRKVLDKKSISILAWSTALRSDYLIPFERETGIKVYVSYCETNEELFLKLKSGEGTSYDLVMPSDHIVPTLVKEGLLQKIDRNQLPFFNHIYPALLNHYFDPGNHYTIPFLWGIYGIGVDTRVVSQQTAYAEGWRLFFDPQIYNGPLGMVDDAREVVDLAAYYLYGESDHITQLDKIQTIMQLLLQQRKRIALYTEDRADYILLSGTAPVVVAPHYDILRAVRNSPHIAFVIPKQGSFLLIDSCALTRTSKKQEYVYQFLNYLFRDDVMQSYAEKFGFLPPVENIELPAIFKNNNVLLTPDIISQLHFFRPIIAQNFLTLIWLYLKA
jgi:spermidine/putrescine transport system substrate-binding protein